MYSPHKLTHACRTPSKSKWLQHEIESARHSLNLMGVNVQVGRINLRALRQQGLLAQPPPGLVRNPREGMTDAEWEHLHRPAVFSAAAEPVARSNLHGYEHDVVRRMVDIDKALTEHQHKQIEHPDGKHDEPSTRIAQEAFSSQWQANSFQKALFNHLVELDLEERAKRAIPYKSLRDAVKRVIDLRLAYIEGDIRRRCTDALAHEINHHAKKTLRIHTRTEYKIYSFGRMPLNILAAMPRPRHYSDLKGVGCRIATAKASIKDAIKALEQLDKIFHDGHGRRKLFTFNLKVIKILAQRNKLGPIEWETFLFHLRSVVMPRPPSDLI